MVLESKRHNCVTTDVNNSTDHSHSLNTAKRTEAVLADILAGNTTQTGHCFQARGEEVVRVGRGE